MTQRELTQGDIIVTAMENKGRLMIRTQAMITYSRCTILQRIVRIRLGFVVAVFTCAMIWGCAPALYSVDMKYVPTKPTPEMKGSEKKIKITVAAFEDIRTISDTTIIGRVIKPDKQNIPVLPKYVRPPMAVASALKDILLKAGYQVAPDIPRWDLKEESIRSEWAPILVGGSIDELEVICEDNVTIKKYRAKAKITVLLANTETRKVFYKVSVQSSVSLEHILFSEERLEEQINSALSDAIEKIFEGNEITAKILDTASGKR
jgi:hypothetical protein